MTLGARVSWELSHMRAAERLGSGRPGQLNYPLKLPDTITLTAEVDPLDLTGKCQSVRTLE